MRVPIKTILVCFFLTYGLLTYGQQKKFKTEKREVSNNFTCKTDINDVYPWYMSFEIDLDYDEFDTYLTYSYKEADSLKRKYEDYYHYKIKEPKTGNMFFFPEQGKFENPYLFLLCKNKKTEEKLQKMMNYIHYYHWKDAYKDSTEIKGIRVKDVKNKMLSSAELNKNIYEKLGYDNFIFSVLTVDDEELEWIEISEGESMNDLLTSIRVARYPLWANHFLFNIETMKWEYIESVYLENDHDQEVYLMQKYAPWYLNEYKKNPYMIERKRYFNGTFINDYLMNSRDKDEFKKLTKEQLRLLRNAFYARKGYKFKSKDLRDFFNQFEWYRTVSKLTSNDEIYLTEQEKRHVAFIRSMEESKGE